MEARVPERNAKHRWVSRAKMWLTWGVLQVAVRVHWRVHDIRTRLIHTEWLGGTHTHNHKRISDYLIKLTPNHSNKIINLFNIMKSFGGDSFQSADGLNSSVRYDDVYHVMAENRLAVHISLYRLFCILSQIALFLPIFYIIWMFLGFFWWYGRHFLFQSRDVRCYKCHNSTDLVISCGLQVNPAKLQVTTLVNKKLILLLRPGCVCEIGSLIITLFW